VRASGAHAEAQRLLDCPVPASATRCRSGRRAQWGPCEAWPTGGGGFEYSYGFIGGETNQYYPATYEGTTAVEPDKTLYMDGNNVDEGRVEATVPMVFSADETMDVGRDTASPVSDDYSGEESVFTRQIKWVQIDLARTQRTRTTRSRPRSGCASRSPGS